jgi:hypothetical protein
VTVENLLSSVEIVEINIAVVSTTEFVTVEMFMVNISMEVTRVEFSKEMDESRRKCSVYREGLK